VNATLTIHDTPLDQWDEVIRAFDCRTVYHSAAWIRTISEEFGAIPRLLSCQDSGGATQLAWPGLVVKKGPLQILGSPLPGWSTPYLGPLAASPEALASVVNGSDLTRRLRRFSYIELRALRQCSSDESFAQIGFVKQSEFETYLLDIASPSEEELWDQLVGRCRTAVRKARKSDISIAFEADASFIDEFWDMSLGVFAKSGLRPQFSKTLLSRLWDELGDGGVKVLTARKDGQRIAMLLLLFDHRTMYNHAACSLPEFNRLGPSNLLHWEAILDAKRMGLRSYDFVSASGAAGKFKASFGPQKIVASTTWNSSRTRTEKVLKQGYEKYLRWRRAAAH
jgi:hypothetical protein